MAEPRPAREYTAQGPRSLFAELEVRDGTGEGVVQKAFDGPADRVRFPRTDGARNRAPEAAGLHRARYRVGRRHVRLGQLGECNGPLDGGFSRHLHDVRGRRGHGACPARGAGDHDRYHHGGAVRGTEGGLSGPDRRARVYRERGLAAQHPAAPLADSQDHLRGRDPGGRRAQRGLYPAGHGSRGGDIPGRLPRDHGLLQRWPGEPRGRQPHTLRGQLARRRHAVPHHYPGGWASRCSWTFTNTGRTAG
jgi:hypothetical protein